MTIFGYSENMKDMIVSTPLGFGILIFLSLVAFVGFFGEEIYARARFFLSNKFQGKVFYQRKP